MEEQKWNFAMAFQIGRVVVALRTLPNRGDFDARRVLEAELGFASGASVVLRKLVEGPAQHRVDRLARSREGVRQGAKGGGGKLIAVGVESLIFQASGATRISDFVGYDLPVFFPPPGVSGSQFFPRGGP